MNTNKKSHGISVLMGNMKPESTMRLEGKHADAVRAHKIGEKVQMVVNATKHSHSMIGGNSASYHVHSVKLNDKDELGGPNKKQSENESDSSESNQ